MNILVIAPHPDDECIGCGGSVRKHTARGDRVVVVFLTSGELGLKQLPREEAWAIREAEAKRAAKILGVAETVFLRLPDWTAGEHIIEGAQLLASVLKREKPSIIYLPHPLEWHPDHKAALPILRAASRKVPLGRVELYGYEVWTPITEYDCVEDISKTLPTKLRALRAHRSQLREFDYVRAVRGLNEYRGAMAGKCNYAEVFQTLSLKPK
ncbi:MAG TPA: PIG-L family deacetylase [Candidatus Angelobacter sp.]|nr:PIG-L family deacetylase [Candidatus Angelobacter sp.]